MKKIVAVSMALLLLFLPSTVQGQCIIPAQTAIVKTTNYTALAADTGKMIVMNCASACTLTLPSTPQSPNWFIWTISIGAGAATVSPNGLTLNGSASNVVLPQRNGAGLTIATDNSNYFAQAFQSGNFYAVGAGTAQAQTVSIVPAPTALFAGLFLAWLPTAANTGAGPTLAVNSLAATTITKNGTAALVANDLTTTAVAYAIYDGTQFQLLNPQTSLAGGTTGQFYGSNGTNPGSFKDTRQVVTIPSAGCVNAVAGAGWSLGASGVVTCRAGTNNTVGYVSITDTAATFATFNVVIPEDWDSGNNPFIRFQIASTDVTSGHTIIPQIKISCAKGDGSTTDDVTFNAAHSLSTVTLNTTANQFWSTSNVQMNSTDMTGCVAGAMMLVQVGRATDTATNAEFYSATLTFPLLTNALQAN